MKSRRAEHERTNEQAKRCSRHGDQATPDLLGYKRNQPVGSRGLVKIAGGAQCLAAMFYIRRCSQKNNWNVANARIFAQGRNEREAVKVGHLDIADDQIGFLREHLVTASDAVFGSLNCVSRVSQMKRQELPHVRVVVNNQYL